ncbi:MAG TPA: EAL domain-containing protein [Mycobacteriales bacterium]|jgi:diguanylate cyclase (GGDEF)-like protein|nr:EAL domain-containing protein [Mycobacteriales bacterium]
MSTAEHAAFVELLTRVGCHVYTGEVLPDGSYQEVYTGPGIEIFLGGDPAPGTDLSAAWNSAVHPDDREAYRSAATVDTPGVMQLEYRMVGRDGVTRWVLDQMWQRGAQPDGRRIIDGVVTDISSRKEAELGLRRLAHSDSLTGLSNRLYLAGRIDEAVDRLRPDSPGIALLLLDLDGFKAVNDSFGHAIGDELLVMVARRLRGSLRPRDVAARLGGDEFAVLLESVDHTSAYAAAQRILAAVSTPFVLSRSTVAISASIGLVHASDDRDGQDLMRDADVAMYRAKADGRSRVVSFEPAMQARVLRRLRLETELRRGVENNEFGLHYQPLIDLGTLEIVGVEALIRWHHPTRGLLPPAEFIDVAEDTGLIVPIGRWVIEQATRDAASWKSATGEQLSISVNLSPRQLHDPDLIDIAAGALESAGLAAAVLIIEITENLLLKDAELARSRLGALRELGVKVAVDDFGTGYSSLAYLDRYPIDILKIDRSFVVGLGESAKSAALLRSIVDLAAALEIDAIAEGVENQAQLATLQSLGCRYAQGFYFARPLPSAEIIGLLNETVVPPQAEPQVSLSH